MVQEETGEGRRLASREKWGDSVHGKPAAWDVKPEAKEGVGVAGGGG